MKQDIQRQNILFSCSRRILCSCQPYNKRKKNPSWMFLFWMRTVLKKERPHFSWGLEKKGSNQFTKLPRQRWVNRLLKQAWTEHENPCFLEVTFVLSHGKILWDVNLSSLELTCTWQTVLWGSFTLYDLHAKQCKVLATGQNYIFGWSNWKKNPLLKKIVAYPESKRWAPPYVKVNQW